MTGLPEFRCIRYNEDKLNPGAGCGDYFTLADGTKICQIRSDTAIYVSCENRVKNGECPKGIKEI